MKKAGKLFVLGMIAMGVLSACGTKDEPNGAASKDVETSVRTAAPSYTPAKETPRLPRWRNIRFKQTQRSAYYR